MKVNVATVDIKKTRDAWPVGEFQPALVLPRKDNIRWQVLDAPHTPGNVPVWAGTEFDEYVRIPLFQYHLNPNADYAFAFMLQLGLSFVGHLHQPITRMHIVTGDPVELVYDSDNKLTHLVCWIGFAVAFD